MQISSFTVRPSGGYGRFNKAPLAGGLAWKATSSFPGPMSARFNSTSSAASDASAASENLSDQAGSISNLSLDDINSIPEHIGYLKDLGLDFGWGPTSLIEYIIEHLHMWTGMPWWASIVATGLLIRAALVYPMLGASDTATKIQNLKHLSTPIRMRMLQHQAAGNSMELAKAKAEMSKLHQANGVDTKKAFIPFIQIPLGFGCYRLIKGMAALPVPGLAAESVAWLQDLTVADPYYILPTLSAGMMYLTFKVSFTHNKYSSRLAARSTLISFFSKQQKGGEAGMNEFQNSSFGKAMLFGLPAFSFAFMAWFPSALQLYFASTGLFALCQSHVLRNEQIRKSLGLAIPNKEQPPSNPLTAEGASKGLRLLQEAIEAEKAKMAEQQKQNPSAPVPDISFIDRMLNNIKESKDNIQREATEKMNEMRGETPGQNADGTPAEPPRLNEKDRKLAADYERRRKEEEDWKRDERNHARREAHMRALEAQREKARVSWEKNASQFKQR